MIECVRGNIASQPDMDAIVNAANAELRIGAEYFSFGAGTDITELLHGLEDNSCQSPHWGYVGKGSITALYIDGKEETSRGGDLFYWPPGHSVRAEEDTDIVMFSPQKEHGAVIDHIRHKIES